MPAVRLNAALQTGAVIPAGKTGAPDKVWTGLADITASSGYNGERSGSSSVAERQLPKLNVAGSIPVSRSSLLAAHPGS